MQQNWWEFRFHERHDQSRQIHPPEFLALTKHHATVAEASVIPGEFRARRWSAMGDLQGQNRQLQRRRVL